MGEDRRTKGTAADLGLNWEQLYRSESRAVQGANGEGTHLPDCERAHLDGGAEQRKRQVLCGVAGQGGEGAVVGATVSG